MEQHTLVPKGPSVSELAAANVGTWRRSTLCNNVLKDKMSDLRRFVPDDV